ncbi:MarR family winged helix-turn-helix transcriptional regulator [Croceivirga radicis]|uniref:MarR family winged helix-turn-helix transcriptional regulator n=1 Tax=Croceivirga radicis TaxID=1929488 RepID=UPI000316D51A|nr:MarR family transcriptional regulator [Croceivirga radicis]
MEEKASNRSIFYSIENAIKEYRKMAQKRINAVVKDITIDQAMLLFQLSKKPRFTKSEMANFVYKDHASITRIIRLMEKAGYITTVQDKEDKRKAYLVITQFGSEVLQKIAPIINENRSIGLKGLSKEQVEQTQVVLDLIANNSQNIKKP